MCTGKSTYHTRCHVFLTSTTVLLSHCLSVAFLSCVISFANNALPCCYTCEVVFRACEATDAHEYTRARAQMYTQKLSETDRNGKSKDEMVKGG